MPKRSVLSSLNSPQQAAEGGPTASRSSLAVGQFSLNLSGRVKSPTRSSTTASNNLPTSGTTQSGATAPVLPFYKSAVGWKPHLGQKRAVKFLLDHAAAGLFADPGVGKTSAVLAAFHKLKEQGVASRMLVIAPLRPVTLVWPRETAKWQQFKNLRVAVLHGKDKQAALDSDADIYVINYEGLPWLLGATATPSFGGKRKNVSIDLARFRKYNFDTLVIDELSKLKHTNTVTFKAIKPILPTFARRWGLTGSPASNGLEGLFGQVYCLDTGRSFGQYITHYRNEFFLPHPSGFGWKVQQGAEEKIYKRIAPVVLRLAASDYVDMPLLVENRIEFDLPKDVRKIYDQVEDEMFAALESGKVVAANAAAASSKCRQIANGGVYLEGDDESPDDRRRWENLHMMKVDLLEDLVAELQGEPLLVALDFYHDLDRVRQRFGKNTPYIGGGISTKKSDEIIDAWNRGEIPLLAGHPKSLGHGVNAQESGFHIAWHSLTWDLEYYDQFNGRIARQGQKSKRVFLHHLIAKKTIDEDMLFALRYKSKGQGALFEALKQRRRG